MLIPSLLVLKMAFVDELLRRTEFVKSPSGDGSSSAYSHELAISQKLGLIAMESHIVAVDGKAVLHQILTISFDSGLSDEIANPENHGKVDHWGSSRVSSSRHSALWMCQTWRTMAR
ncbi:hypothetical protein WJ968_32910 [Achromobacter xylosoxidans]